MRHRGGVEGIQGPQPSFGSSRSSGHSRGVTARLSHGLRMLLTSLPADCVAHRLSPLSELVPKDPAPFPSPQGLVFVHATIHPPVTWNQNLSHLGVFLSPNQTVTTSYPCSYPASLTEEMLTQLMRTLGSQTPHRTSLLLLLALPLPVSRAG